MVISEDVADWRFAYQALFMGQLMDTGDEKWKFYNAFEYDLPTEEDL
jgi:hypothetical protein